MIVQAKQQNNKAIRKAFYTAIAITLIQMLLIPLCYFSILEAFPDMAQKLLIGYFIKLVCWALMTAYLLVYFKVDTSSWKTPRILLICSCVKMATKSQMRYQLLLAKEEELLKKVMEKPLKDLE